MRIQAPSRRRPGRRVPSALAELAVPAMTVVFGLQLLRLMVSTVVSVYRDRFGAPLTSLALFAFCVVGLGFLGAAVARRLGRRWALVLTVAGVAAVRLALQLVPDAGVRWLAAPLGVVLFLWFVPLWLARDAGGFGLALLVGLAVDTALHGLGGSWDYAWSTGGWPVALAAVAAGATLWALAACPGLDRAGAPGWRPGDAAPLAGIGPALFLHALFWQNLGWQATIGGRSQAAAFLLVSLANLGALAAGTVAARAGRPGWPVVGTAVVGLWVAVALGEAATIAAGFLGQAATAILLVAITRRAGRPGGGRPGGVVAAWTAGMCLFVLLVFGYYAAYDLVLPFDNQVVPALAAILVGLAGIAASRDGSHPGGRPEGSGEPRREREGRRRRDLVPVGVGVALLLAPAVFWASAPTPVRSRPGQGAPPAPAVRLLSYNLHFGFDVEGWSDLEATARAIERTGAEVVGLQEVSRGWYVNGSTDMLAWLQRRLRMPHARFAGASDEVWGNAVLSRYPIVADGKVQLPREGVPLRRNSLWVDLDLGAGPPLRVVVTHLHHVEGPAGARVRQAQIRRLLEGVEARPATVLMGDLNAEPSSGEIAMLRGAGLVDAFTAAGGGQRDELTWPSDRPDRRIDYLWLSPDLAATGFVATTGTASDHRGVAAAVGPARPS